VGSARKKALLRRFGSLARLSRASVEEIAATPGVGPGLARAVHARLTGVPSPGQRRESA
jgi:excinuclease ABC subunit C